MPAPTYHHRAKGAKVYYNEQGVHLTTFWGLGKLSIDWNEIEFLSVVPHYDSSIEDLEFLQVKLVFHDRRPMLKRGNLWVKLWLFWGSKLRPLVDENDQWSKSKGRLKLEVDLDSLCLPLPSIVSIWKNNAQFGTLVNF